MIITINGTQRQANIRMASLQIVKTRNTHDAGSTVTMRVRGFTPVVGQDVHIYLGLTATNPEFGGTIITVDQVVDGRQANVAYDLTVQDYVFLLNRRLVYKAYASQSASAIAANLISSFTAGFTSAHVEAGLASVAITYAGDTVSAALTRLAEVIGGTCSWFMDPLKDLYFFVTDPRTPPATVTALNCRDFLVTTDLAQVRTREHVNGASASALLSASPGTTILPLSDGAGFDGSGGTARASAQTFPYTGANGASPVADATGTLNIAHFSNGGGLTANGVYKWGVTLTTAQGETAVAAFSAPYTANATGLDRPTVDRTTVSSDPAILTTNIHRTKANGSVYYRVPSLQGLSGLYLSGATDPDFDANLITLSPTVNTAGLSMGVGSTTTGAVAVGATTIPVTNTYSFYAGGGAIQVGGQTITYTGRSTSSGAGNLTGVPQTGPGCVSAAIASGATIVGVPALTGISGITDQISPGDPITAFVVRDDTTAQTALAALEGGDGIREHVVSDASVLTTAGLRALGDADLALYKNPETRVTFKSRDANFAPGVTAPISIGAPTNVSASLIVQQVTIGGFDEESPTTVLTPWRDIVCAPTRFTLNDLLKLIAPANPT